MKRNSRYDVQLSPAKFLVRLHLRAKPTMEATKDYITMMSA